ncbi:MAG: hypothetical protein ACJAT7_002941 [Psychromonas sp.]|jgi:hypothetical protein|uniref:DUF3466 family protein n=1 Tax=Psychromonas sp. TaxID=1884585 RepID=UPI0039E653DC
MKCKVSLAAVFLLLASNSWADQLPYYTVEEIDVTAEGAQFGPFPSAISDDGELIGTYSMKAALSSNIDIALPFTFNRPCHYDSIICNLEFYGSETAGDLSYENGYQDWREAQAQAANGYSSYFMGNTLLNGSDQSHIPYALGDNSTDVKVTDVTNPLPSETGERFVVGYSSAPYQAGTREFVRRAFVKSLNGDVTSLLPDFSSNGGLTSAYKLQDVTYENGTSKTLVIGSSSVSYPRGSDEYFNYCFLSSQDDQISTLNELVYCPGFDTQAWAWDATTAINGDLSDLSGFPLATQWLENNTTNNGDYLTYSASAFDINSSGIAVGASTFENSNSSIGGRQRAVIMTPSETGSYATPTVISSATADIGSTSDQENGIYNTWAQVITDSNVVVGNREYATAKGRNMPFEFFIYDINSAAIKLPLLNKKVLTTKQRLAGETGAKTGANSLAYDMNEAGFVVGEADDYDQTDPVYLASPRSQSAFLYDNSSDGSWLINDLICSETDSVVTTPYLRIRSARVINDNGTVLAEGYKYGSAYDYKNKVNAQHVTLKLTRNSAVTTPDDSPNCWQSDLLSVDETPYERAGAASFWLWIFALPLLLVRRFSK